MTTLDDLKRIEHSPTVYCLGLPTIARILRELVEEHARANKVRAAAAHVQDNNDNAKTVDQEEFDRDPDAVYRYAVDHGPVTIVDMAGRSTMTVCVPRLEPSPCCAQARADERAKVIAAVRHESQFYSAGVRCEIEKIADRIEEREP